MAKKKLKIGVLFGGKSVEHEVSLQSALNIINSLDKNKYDVVPIGINKEGKWLLNLSSDYLLNSNDPQNIKLKESSNQVALISNSLTNINNPQKSEKLDVIFPVLHGPYGEDGSVQGLLKLAGIPFVGASVLGSAVGMDKDVMKRLLRDSGFNVGKFIVLKDGEKISFTETKKKLGMPVFVKPANTGSSVGINKVKNEKEFNNAIKTAFQFDSKILIEEFTSGQEIECSVLGNNEPIVSVPGEIIPNDEFYSYNAKYILEDGAALLIPARLSKSVSKNVQKTAIKVFKVLNCEGMGRVDFFVKKNGEIYVNEINTIPGFTAISMYPKLWEATGLPLNKLLDRLIELALERFEKEQKLRTSY